MVHHYENTEVKNLQNGGKVVRKVSIKNGKGYKSVTKYHKGRKVANIKKQINKDHIARIKMGEFIPGLFSDCRCNKKTRRNK
jgi:hypothetical protein